MWAVIKNNKYFFILYGLFLLAGFVFQLIYSQAEIFLFFNIHSFYLGDIIIPHWTSLGDGLFSIVVILILLLFKNYKEGLVFAVIFIVSSGLAQFIKNYIYPSSPRPQPFFLKLHENIHIINGVEIHQYNSFPSGHSTSAFALFCFLAIIWKNKLGGIILFLLAFSVGYSRMYLAQHFFGDIYVGSVIGVGCTLVFYVLFENLKIKNWHEKSLLRR